MKHAVALLVFRPDGSERVLAISRGEDMQDWGLIAGKVESNETLERAIQREAREEAQVAFYPFPLIPVFTSKTRTRLTTTFLAQRGGVEILPISKISMTREGRVDWKNPASLVGPSCTYAEYNRRLFEYLGVL